MTNHLGNSEGQTASINGLEAKFIDINGIKTRYYKQGEGEPLLMLHGGSFASGTSSANTWSRNISGLAKEFQVFAPDRLGCGMTDNPKEPNDYLFKNELNHVWEFIDNQGLDEFNIIAQSRGGGLAAPMAVEHPERVKTLILPNGGTLFPRKLKDWAHRREFLFQSIPKDEETPDKAPRYVIESADDYRKLVEVFSYTTEHITDEFVEAAWYMTSQPKVKRAKNVWSQDDYEIYENYHNSVKEKVNETLSLIEDGELNVPTLLFWGYNDPSNTIEEAFLLFDTIAKGNPDVRFNIVNEAGHFPYREYPEEFNQTVIDYINYWTN